MHEPLTTQLVAELMRDLLTAFPSKHSEQNLVHTADVYRNGLRGVSGDAFRAAVDMSIKTDNYFPKIARIRELASEWTKRNVVTMAQGVESRACRSCGKEPIVRERWRPLVTLRCEPVVVDGMLLIEPFARELCDCAGPCWYAPEVNDKGEYESRAFGSGKYAVCSGLNIQRQYKAWRETLAARRTSQLGEAAD